MADDFNWDDYEQVPEFNWNDYEEMDAKPELTRPQRLGGLPFLHQWAESLEKHPGIKNLLGATDKALEPFAKNVAQPFNQAIEGAGIPQFFEKTKIPQAGIGWLEGLADSGASIWNLGAEPLGKATGIDLSAPHPDFSGAIPEDFLSQAAYLGGKIYGDIRGGTKAFSGISALSKTAGAEKAANALRSISPQFLQKIFSKISPDILKGAAAGAAVSENAPGGRVAGGVLGGAGGAIANLATKVTKLTKTPGAEKFGEGILDKVSKFEEMFQKQYNNLTNFAEKNNVKLNLSPKEIKTLQKDLGRIKFNERESQLKSVMDFMKNPTLTNAHWAQSELGDIERDYEAAKAMQKSLITSKNRTWDSIGRVRTILKNAIDKSFNKTGDPRVSNKYLNLTNDYQRELGPYLNSPAVRQLSEGKLYGKDFVKQLSKEYKFMDAKGAQHPEISEVLKKEKIIEELSKYLWHSAYGIPLAGATIYGAKKTYDALDGY